MRRNRRKLDITLVNAPNYMQHVHTIRGKRTRMPLGIIEAPRILKIPPSRERVYSPPLRPLMAPERRFSVWKAFIWILLILSILLLLFGMGLYDYLSANGRPLY
jgi:hypothetical protein